MSRFPEGLALPIPRGSLISVGDSLLAKRRGTNEPHKGLDLYAAVGTPVLAAKAGHVLRIVKGTTSGRRSSQRAGWFVDVLGADALIYRYLHLGADIRVTPGQPIRIRQQIGTVGDRGTSGIKRSKPHLHFEICRGDYAFARKDYGERIDPKTVLPLGGEAMDWKGILSKAVEIGGPVLGGIIGGAAGSPTAGVAVGTTAGKLLDEFVIKPYVPGEEPQPAGTLSPTVLVSAQPTPAPPAVASPATPMAALTFTPLVAPPQAAPLPPEAQAAASYLRKKGYSSAEVAQHLQGPPPSSSPIRRDPLVSFREKGITSEECAQIVHGVLHEAGWHPEARQALLQGPYAFGEYMRPRQHVPDAQFVARLGQYNHDAVMTANLHHSTERGGQSPALYHGTDDALRAGLGTIAEHPGQKET